jgi:hypothetical protein
MQIDNGILYFGENEANKENIEESQEAITSYLENSKRHQIKINPKFATDNTKTNLKSNNADYLKYLIDNNILSTNAVVNEPTFQGYTNIYLNTGITVTSQPKVSDAGVEINTDNTGITEMFEGASEMGDDVLDILKEFETEPKVENKVLDKIKGFANKSDINIENINRKVEVIVSRNEVEKIYKPITKEDRKNVVNFDKLFNKIGDAINGETNNNKKESHTLLKSLLKEVHPDKFQNENQKLIAEIFTSAMIIVSKQGNKFKVQELYDLFKNEIKSFTENKSENTRNVQENFVSLSEIKGTMENTQLKETQAEVFKDNKSPSERLKDAARMAPIIQKYKESIKEGGQPLNARDQVKLNKWAEENPDAYKKIC